MQLPSSPAAHSANNIFAKIAEHKAFLNTVIILILVNSVLIGMETSSALYASYGQWFRRLDIVLLWLFTIEIAIRLLAVKPTWAFFKNGWNVFDFVIVACGHLLAGGQFITILRILRILRVLRTFSMIPSLRRMINALLMTIPALGNIMFLIALVWYVFGVAGTVLFSAALPEYFGSLPVTLMTLFQIATFESWATGIMHPLLEVMPWAWIYFVIFILIGSFVIINLFIGVIVNNMDQVTKIDQNLEEKHDLDGRNNIDGRTDLKSKLNGDLVRHQDGSEDQVRNEDRSRVEALSSQVDRNWDEGHVVVRTDDIEKIGNQSGDIDRSKVQGSNEMQAGNTVDHRLRGVAQITEDYNRELTALRQEIKDLKAIILEREKKG